MMSEHRGVCLADGPCAQDGQGATVKRPLSVRRNRFLDRQPRQLMSKRDACVHGGDDPRRHALGEMLDLLARKLIEKPELTSARDHRDRIEQGPRRVRQPCGPCEHRIPDRRGDRLTIGCQHLGDEERVPARTRVKLLGIDVVRRRQLGHGCLGEWVDGDPSGGADDLAQHHAQPVRSVEFIVAIAGEHQRGSRRDPGADQRQDVDRGLVGPVQILQHQHRRRPAAKLAKEGRRDLVRTFRSRDGALELTSDRLGDVEQRSERTRRLQRRTRAPHHAARAADVVAEALEHRRLPGPGLAANEHQSAGRAGPDLAQQLCERGKLRLALQQRVTEPSGTPVDHDRGQSPTHGSGRPGRETSPRPGAGVRLWQHGVCAGDGSSLPPRRPRRGARSPRPRQCLRRPTENLPNRSLRAPARRSRPVRAGLYARVTDRRTAEPAHLPGARPRSWPLRPETNA